MARQALQLALAFLVVDDIGGDLAVELVNQVVAAGDDGVFVPVGDIDFHRLGFFHDPLVAVAVDNDRLPVLGDNGAAPLVVEHGVVGGLRVNVALIAADRPGADFLQLLAAILNAGVVAALSNFRSSTQSSSPYRRARSETGCTAVAFRRS